MVMTSWMLGMRLRSLGRSKLSTKPKDRYLQWLFTCPAEAKLPGNTEGENFDWLTHCLLTFSTSGLLARSRGSTTVDLTDEVHLFFLSFSGQVLVPMATVSPEGG